MHGFQLRAKLPASLNMTKPRYQAVAGADIPAVTDDDGTRVRVVCGEFWGKKGPIEGVAADPRYLDISIAPRQRKRIPVERPRHVFASVFAGPGSVRDASGPQDVRNELAGGEADLKNRSLVLFDSGDEVVVDAGDEGIRFLLVSGKPIEEPVAWHGPIVMNTQAELRQAMRELQLGTFIK